MSSLINLPETLGLIKRCWCLSEERVCNLISNKYHAHDEIFITRLLYGEMEEELNKCNKEGLFKTNFLNDLRSIFNTDELKYEVCRLSEGIIARITYHEPDMEKKSGADFGMAVIRPNIEKIKKNQLKHSMHQQGVLCQAKRQKINQNMGQLTDKQKEIIPGYLDFYALLLYVYSDCDRKQLQPFVWSNYKWSDVGEIEYFLKYYEDEETINSDKLLELLGNGRIGTENQDIINSIICPEIKSYIKIEITWTDGPPPPPGPDSPNNLYLVDNDNFNIQQKSKPVYSPPIQHFKTFNNSL